MRRLMGVLGVAVVGSMLGPLAEPAAASCPADSVESGTVCMDKYEASVWAVPSTQKSLISKIQKGTVKVTDLTSAKAVAAGVAHLGLAGGDLAAAGCPDTGNGCVSVYAVSIAGVAPAAFITWFQAAAAARNSLKRLPTNQEWQAAALGTPDGAPCNVISGSLANTGSASGCVSDVGAFDMVGNVYEWVADWVSHLSTNCLTGSLFGTGDDNCLNGLGVASTTDGPGAMARGGDGFFSDAFAGVFAIGNASPSTSSFNTGFRAVR